MKRILLSALLIAAMSSCSKDEPAVGPDGMTEIKLSSGIAAQTKAAISGTDVAVKDLQFLRVDGSATTNNFTGKLAIAGDRALGGAITFGSAQYYAATDHSYFASYYPAGPVVSNVVTWPIDAKTDIMTAATIDAGTKSAPIPAASLTYKHQLAQVEVICNVSASASATSIQARWGKINGINMKTTPTTVNYAYNGLLVTPGVTTGDIALVASDYATTFSPTEIAGTTGNTTVCAAGMFAPSLSQSFQLEVVTEKAGTKTVSVDLGAGNSIVKGKKHVITLSFYPEPEVGEVAIAVTSTIEDWTKGATGTGKLE